MRAHAYVADFAQRHAVLVVVEPACPLDGIAYLHRVAVFVQGSSDAPCDVPPGGVEGSTGILEHSAPFSLCRMILAELLSVLEVSA